MEINEDKEGKTPIFIKDNQLYSLTATSDNAVVLYNTYNPFNIENAINRFNVKALNIQKALKCISNPENIVHFNVLNNNFNYNDDNIKFNIKLLSDNLILLPKINIDNIKNFPFVSDIKIDSVTFAQIRRALDFTASTSKFYVEKEGDKLYFLFGDKVSDGGLMYDDIKVLVSDHFTGDIPSSIFNTKILDLLERTKNEIVFKIGRNAMMANIKYDNSELQYLTPALKK